MWILFDLLDLVSLYNISRIDEKDIGRNLNHVKKYQWFQDYLKDGKYKELIIHDKDVRQVIGKFKTKRMDKTFYNAKYQERLHKVLQKKSRMSA